MTLTQIPTIDIQRAHDRSSTLHALDAACTDWGFFQIVGHDIDERSRAELLEQMRRFFELPITHKQSVVRTAENAWGFYDQELTKNVRDWKEIFDVGPAEIDGPLAGATPQWPVSLPEFRPTIETYAIACEEVARSLLSNIAELLGTEPETLDHAFEPEHSSYMRLNYYPLCETPATPDSPTRPEQGHLGISHHSDAGALTVLMQSNVAGLQVERNGSWHLVEPHDDALVINIGDIVQVWSNDRYKAPLHRVIASSQFERFSAAYFFNPSYAATYAPLPGVCDQKNPPRYSPINWGEFRAGRAAGDYADYGEEIQISRFRVAT